MFHHVKELQFNARVSGPDPRFANMLLEQFGGANGELKAALQYFVQSFGVRQSHPDKYDMLMDIATEEFSHLEIVGATITMLLDGIGGELKETAEESDLMGLLDGSSKKQELIHAAMANPHFLIVSGGGPMLTDSRGAPFSGTYISANGDPTVDLRSNMAAEARAKITYEYLLQFTDDPYVKDSLRFLMAREVAHYQMFGAALETIQPNFPPGTLQGDPRFTNTYYDLSSGASARGPWNEGKSPDLGETWQYVEDPHQHVIETEGLTTREPRGTDRTPDEVQKRDRKLGKERADAMRKAIPEGPNQWSAYPQEQPESPKAPEPTKASKAAKGSKSKKA